MELIEMKTVTITEKGQMALPKDIREIEGFKEGQKVVMLAYKDRVVIRPLKKMDPEELGWLSLAEKSWAKDWLTPEEDKAWKHLKKGT
ncbi:MAG: AbrB/MazE/SpoVT family DNA-binding domain-containing protein [Candidatus Woesearchaeota archaeon]|nr:AbrB/MazE/SpoVT family DNA-binding domain-containing protein [Candidatus Woesearchaeota archaeon]